MRSRNSNLERLAQAQRKREALERLLTSAADQQQPAAPRQETKRNRRG